MMGEQWMGAGPPLMETRFIRLVAAFAVWLGLAVGVGEAAGDLATRPATSPATTGQATTSFAPDRAAALIDELGHRRWALRERATATLKRGDSAMLAPLARAYKANHATEVRLRIKEIVEHIVVTEALASTRGFLGIGQQLVSRAEDGRLPEGQMGVVIARVLPGTAAAAAGLAVKDVIVALDGQPIKLGTTPEGFRDRIASHPPGTKIELTVLRGKEIRPVRAVLGTRPPGQVDERSEEYARARKRFGTLWREQFDPNDVRLRWLGQMQEHRQRVIEIRRRLEE